jgi:DNA polymerase-3 subunit gamma/tau
MASQALYRRYRSQTFDELVGQKHIVQTLRNALQEGRLAHAYLFTGPRGVGKTTVARLLAKAVNCTAPQEQRPCGVCESCVAIAEGRAVDVIEMDAASNTSVEDARVIIERVQFRPTSGAYKVYIIDETHMLSTAAFNALLKTLEEPPGHALFILATTEIHKVPATIMSRCQRFTFNRHSVAGTVAHLHDIAQNEQFVLEPGVAEALARAATGSMRDALSLLDQLMAYGGGRITLEQVQNLLGATEAQEVAALVDALIANDCAEALRAVANVSEQGADLRQFARDVVERLRALMLLKAGGDSALLDATDDELASLNAQANAADVGMFLHWVKLFSALDFQIRTSAIPQLPLEMAIVEALTGERRTTTDDRREPGVRGQGSGVRSQTTDHRPLGVRGQGSGVRGQGAEVKRPTTDHGRQLDDGQQTTTDGRRPTDDSEPISNLSTTLRTSLQSPIASDERRTTDDDRRETVNQSPIANRQSPLTDDDRQEIASEPPIANLQSPPTNDERQTTGDSEPVANLQSPEPVADHGDTRSHDQIASENAAVAALEQVESIWPEVVRDVRVYDKMLQALLNSGVRPVDVQDDTVVLEVANEWLLNRLDMPKLRQTVERVLSKHMGAPYFIRCVVEAQRSENPNVLREQIRDSRKDPHVKAAINIFDADIIAVKPNDE